MEDTVQILVAVTVLYFAYSWLFKAKPDEANAAAGARGQGSSNAGGAPVLGRGAFRHVSEAMVDNVSAAFPDVPREHIIYDLSRTRNAQATVEKLLTTGYLPAPPPGMFPPAPPVRPAGASAASAATTTTSATTARPPTLIDRFGLHERLPPAPSAKGKERAVDDELAASANEAEGKGKAAVKGNAAKWEASAEAREASLKRRKEEMVLEARRKLLAKRAKQEAERASA